MKIIKKNIENFRRTNHGIAYFNIPMINDPICENGMTWLEAKIFAEQYGLTLKAWHRRRFSACKK